MDLVKCYWTPTLHMVPPSYTFMLVQDQWKGAAEEMGGGRTAKHSHKQKKTIKNYLSRCQITEMDKKTKNSNDILIWMPNPFHLEMTATEMWQPMEERMIIKTNILWPYSLVAYSIPQPNIHWGLLYIWMYFQNKINTFYRMCFNASLLRFKNKNIPNKYMCVTESDLKDTEKKDIFISAFS